jgi:PAS domain S-box-containing protein
VHGSTDGIWDWPDCETEEQWWSPRFYDLLGYGDGEIAAGLRNLTLLLHPDDRQRVLAALNEHLDSGEHLEIECRLAAKGGGYRWFLLRGAARAGGEGRPRRMAGSLQDMTERKVAAQALTAANEQLAAANEEMASINEELATTNDDLLNEVHLRRQAEEQLQASLQEKVVLLKEIHHRVKNNLQVVSSLLGLQAATVQDPGVLELFEEGKNRIASMALVHEELYRSPDLAQVNLETYLERLVRRLVAGQTGARRVETLVRVADVRLPVDLAIPCGLVVNELVTNALKHGMRGRPRGELAVSAERAGGLVRMLVADDGPGFPPDLDYRQTETLGMQLVVNLVSQLHGELELEDRPGCAFRFVFPEKHP